MKLNEINLPLGRKKKKTKRLGRGDSSGTGGTAGRGHKGQKARSGGYHKVGFEGGQMPLQRRLPKRGFHNNFRKVYSIINVDTLNTLPAGTEVNETFLREKGWIKGKNAGVKILGRGEITTALNVKAHIVTESAKGKIEAAGGKVEVICG